MEDVAGRGETEVLHDQSLIVGEARLRLEYALTGRVGLIAMVPLRWMDTDIRYLDTAGQPVELNNPGIHHRDERLVGLGDPWLLGGYAHRAGALEIGLQAGLTVPLGSTEDDPFLLGDMGQPHQHIQFGTGTVDPLVILEGRYRFARWSLSGYALTRQTLYENSKGYQSGDRYATGVAASSPLGTRSWRFRAGTELQAESGELWNGIRYEEEGNQGRIDLLLSAGVQRRLSEGLEATASLKVPVFTHVVGGQLDYPAIVEVGITGTFNLLDGGAGAGDEHGDEHDHDHGDEHHHGDEHGHGDEHDHDHDDGDHDDHDHGEGHDPDHGEGHDHAHGDGDDGHSDASDLDIASITDDGSDVPLEPVAGKVTVFDFWATWCAPCVELERDLTALARRYPGRLAIRKLNVTDWEVPAAERYLTPGGFNLPHLKVFGPDGKLRFERSGEVDELVEAVEALLSDD